jgi:hypothetical protein
MIRYDGRSVQGKIELASSNGASLMLKFETVLGGYVGMMPVIREGDGPAYLDLIEGKPVTVERMS